MGIRKYKPTSPGRRFMTVSTFEEVTKTTPERKLVRVLGATEFDESGTQPSSKEFEKRFRHRTRSVIEFGKFDIQTANGTPVAHDRLSI